MIFPGIFIENVFQIVRQQDTIPIGEMVDYDR